MSRTPPIPERFRTYRCPPRWKNIFEIYPSCERLYATETMSEFSHWDGQVLLLAKDAAPLSVFKKLGEKHPGSCDDAWRHASRERGDRGGVRTNERLIKLVGWLPSSCKALYGSAAANMVYDDGESNTMSRPLPDMHRAGTDGRLHEYLVEVLRWVAANMPNLRVIACLGQDAWRLSAVAFGGEQNFDLTRDYSKRRDNAEHAAVNFEERKLSLMPLFHPAARGVTEKMNFGWHQLSALLAKEIYHSADGA